MSDTGNVFKQQLNRLVDDMTDQARKADRHAVKVVQSRSPASGQDLLYIVCNQAAQSAVQRQLAEKYRTVKSGGDIYVEFGDGQWAMVSFQVCGVEVRAQTETHLKNSRIYVSMPYVAEEEIMRILADLNRDFKADSITVGKSADICGADMYVTFGNRRGWITYSVTSCSFVDPDNLRDFIDIVERFAEEHGLNFNIGKNMKRAAWR